MLLPFSQGSTNTVSQFGNRIVARSIGSLLWSGLLFLVGRFELLYLRHSVKFPGVAIPLAGIAGMDLRLLCLDYLADDDRQKVNFLFRLYQPRNNRSKFIEYLVPALHLTAIFRALHGFISNEGKFRLAVSEILKDGHVVRTVYSLMFYS